MLAAIWVNVKSALRLSYRFCLLLGVIALGLAIVLARFPFIDRHARNHWIKRWSSWQLAVCGVKIRLHGEFPPSDQGVLIVANHVSWLDISVINASRTSRFIAKSEVAKWPFVGFLVARVGTLFIDRGRRRAVQHMLHTVAGHLEQAETVAVFPEGTISDGRKLLPFHGNLIQAAISTGSPVLPVGIAYHDEHGLRSDAPLFVDDITLLDSVARILSTRQLVAHVHVLTPISVPADARRSQIAAQARLAISQALGLELEDKRPEILAARVA